jgi:DNA-binding transcriptional ArsR family regulator
VRAARAALIGPEATPVLERMRAALCEPTRTQILRVLSAGQLTVGDLAAVISRGRTVSSQHLRVLREENLVVARRRGRRVYYGLTAEPAAQSILDALDLVVQAAG